MIEHTFKVKQNLVGKRLDLAIVSAGLKLSRRQAKSIIDDGNAFVNGQRIRISSRVLNFGDQVRILYHEVKKTPSSVELSSEDILFRKDGILVINKPSGLPTQASKETDKNQVLPALSRLWQKQDWRREEFHLIHRLDKNTSGVLVLAESTEIRHQLEKQFRDRMVEKHYEAICHGKAEETKSLSCRLSAIAPHSGKVKVVSKGGKASETHFELAAYSEEHDVSHVRCQPITGRSHQIRVHLAYLNTPIVADHIYGSKPSELVTFLGSDYPDRQLLHARSIKLINPVTGSPIKVKSPYPDDFKFMLDHLGLR